MCAVRINYGFINSYNDKTNENYFVIKSSLEIR